MIANSSAASDDDEVVLVFESPSFCFACSTISARTCSAIETAEKIESINASEALRRCAGRVVDEVGESIEEVRVSDDSRDKGRCKTECFDTLR